MALKGLGINNRPFIYLDEYCPDIDWHKLHADVCYGLAGCQWIKRYVSAGVHPDWSESEITTHIIKNNFTDYQKQLHDTIPRADTERRIKYTSLLTTGLHPFWSCYLRVNKRVEFTGINNKSVGADCEWTENAQHFPTLVEFIKQLPFAEIGRVMCFITEPNNETVPHFDDALNAPGRENDDFIWFTTTDEYKRIFVMDGETKEKTYYESGKKLVWFNEMDYHGTDPINRLTFSVRIDGKFLPEIKHKLLKEN
jgi:hypothetical protein